MYENIKKEKEFTLEQTKQSIKLTEQQVSILISRYNINELPKEGCLTMEIYSNNIDKNLDYDVTLQIESKENHIENYPLKTSSNLEKMSNFFDEISNYCYQQIA